LPSNLGGGENYGWRDREGFIQNPTYATATPTPTPVPPRVDPIFDYPRTNSGAPSPISGRTVVGGYVYRGKQIPQLQGTYVFGDYLGPSDAPGGRIHTLNFDGTNAFNPQNITGQLFPTSVGNFSLSAPAGFGEDANGEIYICDINTGDVFRIVPTTPNVKIDNVSKNGNPFVLRGIGVPFTSVTVQSTGNLTQAFGSPVSVPVIGDGTFQFTDPNPSSPRFYRVVYP